MGNQEHEKNREFLTAVYRDLSEAERLLRADSKCLHYRSSVGETAFHYLIVESKLDQAAKLLEWGADINTQDDFGSTPLTHAVMLGDLAVVKWLVEHGASLELKTVNGDTALSMATSNSKAAIFQYLIKIPREHPIDYYYDDFTAEEILDSGDLVMKEFLVGSGLSRRLD